MECKWYSFIHDRGAFPVCFRPYGVFIAPDYPTSSSYSYGHNPHTNQIDIQIEFGKFGKYAFSSVDGNPGHFAGSVLNEPSNWRKLEFLSDFTAGITSFLCKTISFNVEKVIVFMLHCRGEAYVHWWHCVVIRVGERLF
jgi:hypothetical protein